MNAQIVTLAYVRQFISSVNHFKRADCDITKVWLIV